MRKGRGISDRGDRRLRRRLKSVRGGLRGIERGSGNNAKNERGGDSEEESRDDSRANGGLWISNAVAAILIRRRPLRGDDSKAEIISSG